jgi:hypothetical protein
VPRDLADVLHYFLPELEPGAEGEGSPSTADLATHEPRARTPRPPADTEETRPPLPILGVPMGPRDVLRAALVWNLAVETARLGGASVVLAPESDAPSPLWPEPGVGPLGAELVFRSVETLEDLHREAEALAVSHAARSRRGGIVFVRIPDHWLGTPGPCDQPFRWVLLLSTSRRRDLDETYAWTRRLVESNPRVEIGVTIHGVQTIDEAKRAFDGLHRASERRLGRSLFSYGLLVDDLHVYRAIAAQRPIGIAHPQAPATRALTDVARLLYEDARSRVLG